MSKVIKTDDKTYEQLKKWAEIDMRSISKEVKFMVDSILNGSLQFVHSQKTQVKTAEDEYLAELDRQYAEAMKKPAVDLGGYLLTEKEIKQLEGQNIFETGVMEPSS